MILLHPARRLVAAGALLAALSACSSGVGGDLAGGKVSRDDIERVAARSRLATVQIQIHGCGVDGSGTGFVLGNNVVTNKHVADAGGALTVETLDRREIPVRQVRVSDADDLALLTLGKPLTGALHVARHDPIGGDLVMAVGHPDGGPLQVTQGRITRVGPTQAQPSTTLLHTSAYIRPGSSGSPLVSVRGDVVGVVVAIDLISGESLAIPASRLRLLTQQGGQPAPNACPT